MIKLYGIPNCDTMKMARAWLTGHGIDHEFHDYKKAGIDEAILRGWIGQVGWETLLNRRGMMWRKLPQDLRDAMGEQKAVEVMLKTPGIIKRPVLEINGTIHIGFKPGQYEALFVR